MGPTARTPPVPTYRPPSAGPGGFAPSIAGGGAPGLSVASARSTSGVSAMHVIAPVWSFGELHASSGFPFRQRRRTPSLPPAAIHRPSADTARETDGTGAPV